MEEPGAGDRAEALRALGEPVEADQQQGDGLGVEGSTQREVEAVQEDRPVGEACGLVLEDLLVEAVVHGPLGAQVPGRPGELLPVTPERGPGRHLGAGPGHDVEVPRPQPLRGQGREQGHLEHGAVEVGHEGERVGVLQRFLEGEAEEPTTGRVQVPDGAVLPEHGSQFAGVGEQGAEDRIVRPSIVDGGVVAGASDPWRPRGRRPSGASAPRAASVRPRPGDPPPRRSARSGRRWPARPRPGPVPPP